LQILLNFTKNYNLIIIIQLLKLKIRQIHL